MRQSWVCMCIAMQKAQAEHKPSRIVPFLSLLYCPFLALLHYYYTLLTIPASSPLLVSQGGSTVELQPGDLASFPPGEAMCHHNRSQVHSFIFRCHRLLWEDCLHILQRSILLLLLLLLLYVLLKSKSQSANLMFVHVCAYGLKTVRAF